MSRAAEKAAEEWFARREIEDARDFVVGATVYRAYGGQIEEGTVRVVGRCDDPDYGEKAGGKHPYYAASFGNGMGRWESQTYAWRWFARREDALADLAKQIERSIEDDRRTIRRREEALAKVRAEIAAGPAPTVGSW